MSKNTITLNPQSRRAHKEVFNEKNPWAKGLTLSVVREKVEAGEETLKGGFVFPPKSEGKGKKARASRTTKGGSPRGAKRATSVRAKRSKAERKASKKKSAKFVQWLHDSAEQRHKRQDSNKEMAAWLRENGVQPTGQAWEAAKKGERSVKALKALNKADGVQAKAVKGKAAKGKGKGTAKVTEVVAEVATDAPARVHRLNGSFMNKEETAKYREFRAAGLDHDAARKAVDTLVSR